MKINAYLRLMRLDKPIGVWLLFWPCAWSVGLLAERPWPLLAAFFAGAVLMRSAGCIINDLWDKNIDAQVERTRTRPLASGEIRPRGALLLLAVLLALALGVALSLGRGVTLWAAAALPLVALYPLMKRVTWWPQAFLGLTFNWGALTGGAAAVGTLHPAALMLYISGFFWTLGYDTIYAMQDREDDARIGVKSTARRLGNKVKIFVAACYAACLLCLALAGHGWPFYLALLPILSHFSWQIIRLDINNPSRCRRLFVSNGWAGALVFLACISHAPG